MKHRFQTALLVLPAFAFAMLFNSCSNDDGTKGPGDSTPDSTQTGSTDSAANKDLPTGVPSPSEMFAFMKAAGNTKGDGSLLNPVDNEKKYSSKKAESLNLGIYSADLLYCSTFNVSAQVASYFGVCMRMGTTLNVATSLTEKDKDRIGKNAGNGDSLVSISNDLYLSSFENLENNQRGADLSLMLAGGWVESLYLMSSMVKDFDKDQAIAGRIADQKLSLENLIDFMAIPENSNSDVVAVSGQLKELKAMMDEIKTSDNQAGGMQIKNGKRVLGGGSKPAITKDQFEKIKAKIIEIRNGFINAQ